MNHSLKTYQKRLTNLSANNRSLMLLKLAQKQSLDLTALDQAMSQQAFEYIRMLITGQQQFKICPVIDSRYADGNKASHLLRQLYRADQAVQEERGAQDLYIGYPFVYGRMLNDTAVRAPLLFFPVSLKVVNGYWVLEQRLDAGISFNKTLLLAFSHFNEIPLEEDLLEEDFLDFPKEARLFITELYKLLGESPLEINLGQKAFEEKLEAFEDLTKSGLEEISQTGKLYTKPQAVLGLFPQAGSYLMPDYDFLIQKPHYEDLSSFFFPESPQLKDDPSVHELVMGKAMEEEAVKTPYKQDASQEQAIHAVKTGSSIVVQGPPGSGKSQLICNLIADAMAHGKTVLVVCQKKAALDVVYQRLDAKGLADFTALVHDFKNDRGTIYQKISRNIELIDDFKSANNSLDAIYLERNFLKYSREIDQLTEELDEFREALFDTSECGMSAKELYMTSDEKAPRIRLRQEYEHFRGAEAPELLRKIRNYAKYANQLDKPNYPWADRISFADFGIGDIEDIAQAVSGVLPFHANKAWAVAEIISMEVNLDECEWIHDRAGLFHKMLDIIEDEEVLGYFHHAVGNTGTSRMWLASQRQHVVAAFGDHGVETTLDRKQLGHAVHVLYEAIEAKKKWHQWAKWKLFSTEKVFVEDLIINNSMEGYDDALGILLIMVENRMNLEHHLSNLHAKPWLTNIPEDYRKKTFEQWFDQSVKAIEAKELYDQLRNGIKYVKLEDYSFREIKGKITQLLEEVADVPAKKADWMRYLSRKQILELEEGKVSSDSLLKVLEQDFDVLCEFDRLKKNIEPHELEIIHKLHEEIGSWDADAMVALFENSLKIAWIHHLEAKYPILRAVASHKLEDTELQLREAIERKQEVCLEMVLMHAREGMYKGAEYNRLNNMVTYRDLKHQVNKKRRVWPLRKLIEQFSHELFNLMPCWMASPESVSAIFPMQKLFDLIIFDEASQCFAEKGLPAIYRGKQTVIVGDSQQLSPYDLYQPRWEEEADQEVALEVDSLLDLGCHYLQQFTLLGHYRSEALELIDFSNRYFYQGRLRMLPHSQALLNAPPAIRYLKVEGIWDNQTNPIEAATVVALVQELLEKNITDIGIITFNARQQDLIRDLLEESGTYLPESLFVKNIENVQGDERDVIIFSVGYAPSKSGGLRAQFGSLNQAKGENRLNVAITRARKQIWIISSLMPAQLRVETTKNEGPKLLKAYLQYAYDVSEGNFKPQNAKTTPHTAGWYLKQKIQTLSDGKQPIRQDYPFADLILLNPNNPGVLLTDDELFHQGLSAKDVFAYTPFLLQSKGWRYQRFYSRDYWKDPETFEIQAKKFLQQ